MIPHVLRHSETIYKLLRYHRNHENCYRAGFFSLIYPWYRNRFRRHPSRKKWTRLVAEDVACRPKKRLPGDVAGDL